MTHWAARGFAAQDFLPVGGIALVESGHRTKILSQVSFAVIVKKTLVARERREERRLAFLNELAPYLQDPTHLVFLDESGFNTAMTRLYARAPSQLRAVGRVARNHGLNQTLICGLRLAGPVAPLVIPGAVNGDTFEWYVREQLCPVLEPGQVVVMDNLSSYHRAAIRTLIEARGCTLLY